MKSDTLAVEQKLYAQFNELTEGPEDEVEVSYFSTEGGKDIFKVKGLCYRDFVYSDGTPYRPSFFQRLRGRVFRLLFDHTPVGTIMTRRERQRLRIRTTENLEPFPF